MAKKPRREKHEVGKNYPGKDKAEKTSSISHTGFFAEMKPGDKKTSIISIHFSQKTRIKTKTKKTKTLYVCYKYTIMVSFCFNKPK